jgi:mono/diheme cytochrome c family protein
VVGQPLHLRLTSDDVTHGFAVGQMEGASVDVLPGQVSEVTLVFDKPGKYTFYCTRWCSVNHWRMRGTIEVSGGTDVPGIAEQPLYLRLGLDLDAPHVAPSIPPAIPEAWRGALLKRDVPEQYKGRAYYLSHTPLDLWAALRSEPTLSDLSDAQVWDFVAWVWESNTTTQEVALGKELYAANCAACHGERGAGDGVFAKQPAFADKLASHAASEEDMKPTGEETQPPADFTDAHKMLSASPAHLQGKILRGGMGTGMPYWGPIFTDEQTWAIVSYLYTFQFR